MNTLTGQLSVAENFWQKLSIDKVFLVSSLIIFHLDIFGVKATWMPIFFGLFLGASYFVKSWPVFQLSLMAFLWGTLSYMLPSFLTGISAVYLLVVFLATVGASKLMAPNANQFSWFTKGKIDSLSAIMIAGTAVVSGVALIIWALWTDNLGLGKQMVLSVANLPKPLVLILGVPIFAMLNAFSEEVIYRGFFQESFQKVFGNAAVAIVCQATVFAALHFAAGFPNGAMGYAMTFIYGATLGFLRFRTKGILGPYITHIAADLVIIYFLCYQFL